MDDTNSAGRQPDLGSAAAMPPATKAGSRKPYARVPNSVAHDRRLSAETLALLAYRATFVGPYALNRKFVGKHLKLGDTRFDRALSEMTAASYLRRRSANDGSRRHARAVESIHLPEITDSNYVLVRRHEIESLEMRAAGVYIFVAARPFSGFVFVREVAERFGWNKQTAGKWLSALVREGIIIMEQRRKPNGRMDGVQYMRRHEKALGRAPQSSFPDGEKPDHELPDHAKRDVYIDTPLTEPVQLPILSPHARLPLPGVAGKGNLRAGFAGDGTRELGDGDVYGATSWLDRFADTGGSRVESWGSALGDDDLYEAVARSLDHQSLRQQLKEATRGKIKPALLTDYGLCGFVRLVAAVARHADVDVHAAVRCIVAILDQRLGDRWLNSWAYLGLLLFRELPEGDGMHWFEDDEDSLGSA